jgi:hypothetical protein
MTCSQKSSVCVLPIRWVINVNLDFSVQVMLKTPEMLNYSLLLLCISDNHSKKE